MPEPQASPRVVAALLQALFHGLDVQLMMDPDAFDRQEMFALCLRVLGPRFGKDGAGEGLSSPSPLAGEGKPGASPGAGEG